MRNCALALISLCVASAGILNATSFVVGGFDAARGGFESLAPGEDSALAGDIAAAFPGTTFQFTNTLTPSFLTGVNVVILGVGTSDTSAISPLSASEQTSLSDFVLAGGTALIFSDNNTFEANAPAANASLLAPFGVTATGTLSGSITAPILDMNGPLTTPFSPVTQFQTNYPGYFSEAGTGLVLADLNNNSNQPAVDYFAPGVLGSGSGAVVLFSDSDAMVAGDSLTDTNLNLVRNAFALTGPAPSPIPEPSTLDLLGASAGVGLLIVIRRFRTSVAIARLRGNRDEQILRLPVF